MNIPITGKWKGFFQTETRSFFRRKKVDIGFEANLFATENEKFEGKIEDFQAIMHINAPANVMGTLLPEKGISFVKIYYSHKVFYEGVYEEESQKYTGTWTIREGAGTGYWEMEKDKNETQQEEMDFEEIEIEAGGWI